MASDEWVRGLVMLRRWRSGAWQASGHLAAAGADVAEAAAVEIEEGI
jgi:hypothetical protein